MINRDTESFRLCELGQKLHCLAAFEGAFEMGKSCQVSFINLSGKLSKIILSLQIQRKIRVYFCIDNLR